jgi:ABC-2 type transport system ATP-binding protein
MIEFKNIVKKFNDITAVNDVSFSVNQGEIFGLIGPNGAGKTTCLNMLATLLQPTAGEIFINDQNIRENIRNIRKIIGYMPDFFGTYKQLSIWEYLDFYGGCYEMPYKRRMTRIDEVLELTNLTDKKTELVDNLSRGMKQRLCLAKTLLHEPKLLILDEPASGLDPRARCEIREILKTVAALGATILISSHILTDLENVCSHIAIIEQGKLIKHGPMTELLQKTANRRQIWHIEFANDATQAVKQLKTLPFVDNISIKDSIITVTTTEESDKTAALILKSLLEIDFNFISFQEEKVDLEDAYLNYTSGLLA